LVWLPFDPDRLGDPPGDLAYEAFVPEPDGELPDWLDRVEFYVPPYQWSGDGSAVLARMPQLRVVQTMTAGVEHIRPFVPEGVVLCNGRGIHDASTAELAMTLMLSSLRGIPRFVNAQREHRWDHQMLPALADKTVLIVGYGAIGAALERRLAGFETRVLRVARRPRDGVAGFEELPELVPQADVVVLIVPLTDQTRKMVDAEFLRRMKDGTLLVNVARGGVVDTDALVTELRSGRVTAALDVTDPEPLPEGHPLWDAPGVLISPHVGGATSAMSPRAFAVVRQQLHRFANGEPLANVMTGAY
jgi:phosphoglycerate dehydrogenase-like enzyme